MKDVHIGKKIEEEVYRQGMQVSYFAESIQRSRNVAYDIFKRKTIDTGLLRIISNVLKCDFFTYYITPNQVKQYPATKQDIDELKTLIQNMAKGLKK